MVDLWVCLTLLGLCKILQFSDKLMVFAQQRKDDDGKEWKKIKKVIYYKRYTFSRTALPAG